MATCKVGRRMYLHIRNIFECNYASHFFSSEHALLAEPHVDLDVGGHWREFQFFFKHLQDSETSPQWTSSSSRYPSTIRLVKGWVRVICRNRSAMFVSKWRRCGRLDVSEASFSYNKQDPRCWFREVESSMIKLSMMLIPEMHRAANLGKQPLSKIPVFAFTASCIVLQKQATIVEWAPVCLALTHGFHMSLIRRCSVTELQ
jgi:hypothetical protein